MTLRSTLLAGLIFGLSSTVSCAAEHHCAADAAKQAKALLLFHSHNDDRSEIDKRVTVLPSIKNPANPKQRFDVLEITGYVYKAEYRLRMIYAQFPGDCVLMGQEVLNLADL